MPQSSIVSGQHQPGFLRRHPSVTLLVLLLGLVGIFAVSLFKLQSEQREQEYQRRLLAGSEQARAVTSRLVDEIRLVSLSVERELLLSGVLGAGRAFERSALEDVFISAVGDRPSVSQVRWLDSSGVERARINRRSQADGRSLFVPATSLQDKSREAYFIRAGGLRRGEFYNSYITLNREFGNITVPLEPTVRTATRTHPDLGQRDGFIVVNFSLVETIARLRQMADGFGFELTILDAREGWTYVSTERPDLAFAHEREASDSRFWTYFPQREALHAAFVASGQLRQDSPEVLLTLGWALTGMEDNASNLAKQVWSRDGRVNMSPSGLLFDLRIPKEEVAANRKALERLLILGLIFVSALLGVLAFLAFRLELQNMAALRDAKLLADSKEQFLANMSHEIRTPLTGMIGMLDLIEKSVESPDNQERIRFVKRSSDSLHRIIDDILAVTKLQRGAFELKPVPFSPSACIARVTELYSAAAQEKGIQVLAKPGPELEELVLHGDEFRIEQVLNNLVSNAIKFTEEGEITLGVALEHREDNYADLRFSVTDTGMGMSPEVIEQLGDPFFQSDVSNTRSYGGTGLGVSICNGLLALMGSKLVFASQLGAGTTASFSLTLPSGERACSAPAPAPGGSSTMEEPVAADAAGDSLEGGLLARVQSEGPPRILLVEDSFTMQLLIKAIFENLGIPVVVANHGREALELTATQNFDLVLMDLQMPEMGGVEAITHIRKTLSKETLPIIVLSATVQDSQIQDALEAGGNAFLAKPIDREDLMQLILKFWRSPPLAGESRVNA
ncbi:multi-sensor hybrid histidine kinase [gamma proteobacterium NOR5-3]|nr:multi-sensor hybrid histidine kinase [gamma proteobacterium NOR5-3]